MNDSERRALVQFLGDVGHACLDLKRNLRNADPVLGALENAPIDPRPEAEEEWTAKMAGVAEAVASNKFTPGEEVTAMIARRPHDEFMTRLIRMTPEEVFQTSVRAGIHNPDGSLTEPYAEPPVDEVPRRNCLGPNIEPVPAPFEAFSAASISEESLASMADAERTRRALIDDGDATEHEMEHDVTELVRDALFQLLMCGPQTMGQIFKSVSSDEKLVRKLVKDLVATGEVTQTGRNRGVRYALAAKAAE